MAKILVLPSEVVGEAESENSYAFPADNIIMSDKTTNVEEAINNKPGEKIPGTEEDSVGGEIFNDYTNNIASGDYSHAEGNLTTASGYSSHAEGDYNVASGNSSHAEGSITIASGDFSHAEGYYTTASGNYSHAEGDHTIASSKYQHVQGRYNVEDTESKYAHIVGWGSRPTSRKNIHTITTTGDGWFAGKVSAGTVETPAEPTENNDLITKKYFDENIVKDYTELNNIPTMNSIPISGDKSAVDYGLKPKDFEVTITGEEGALASDTSSADIISAIENNRDVYVLYEGYKYEYISSTSTSVTFEREFGLHKISIKIDGTTVTYTDTEYEVSGSSSSGVGQLYPNEIDEVNNPMGAPGEIFNVYEDSEEYPSIKKNIASGAHSHAEGLGTTASGSISHAEGYYTTVSGDYSHAEGWFTTVSGDHSHAEGYFTTAASYYQHVQGKYNVEDSENKYAHIVGWGTPGLRANIHTIDTNGNGWFSGKVSAGTVDTPAEPVEANDLITKKYFDENSGSGVGQKYIEEENPDATRGEIFNNYTNNIASGEYSHAEGNLTTASGNGSHAEGTGTIAASANQHVQGKYNIEDAESAYAHIIGGGSSDSDRKNIHMIDWNGNAYFDGRVIINPNNINPLGATELVTMGYVNSLLSGGGSENGNFLSDPMLFSLTIGPTIPNEFNNVTKLPDGYSVDNTLILSVIDIPNAVTYFGSSSYDFIIRITEEGYVQIRFINNAESIGRRFYLLLCKFSLPSTINVIDLFNNNNI